MRKYSIHTNNRSVKASIFVLMLTLFIPLQSAFMAGEKLKPEEIINKHLEAIGSQDVRTNAQSRVILGVASSTLQVGGNGKIDGGAVMASEGAKNLIGMTFDAPIYPHDKMAFDGKDFTVSSLKPGVRSSLGKFLLTYNTIFREGLMGGTLSTSWPLLDLAIKSPKLEYGGVKKVNGREAHQIKYRPRKDAGLEITLFFDKETFQHIQTQYQKVFTSLVADQPGITDKRGQSLLKLVEEFSDFKAENGLTLPHNYKLKLTIETENTSYYQDWDLNLTKFVFNRPLDAKEFVVTSE
jgi:hypothetical protein